MRNTELSAFKLEAQHVMNNRGRLLMLFFIISLMFEAVLGSFINILSADGLSGGGGGGASPLSLVRSYISCLPDNTHANA